MGVKGIWLHMRQYGTIVDLASLHGKTLAIDGQIWLLEAQKGSESHGKNPRQSYLVLFYNRCMRLIENGITPLVVFDDLEEEEIKATLTNARPEKMAKDGLEDIIVKIHEIRNLLYVMGVRCLVGGHDGEAQCAQLEQAGFVHGCVTQDFDFFLFGGRNLYKIDFTSGSKSVEAVGHWSMDRLEKDNLNRNRLVALAMLLGCDYYTHGVKQVGIVGALECDFGVHVAKLMSEMQLSEILADFSLHLDDHPIVILDRFSVVATGEMTPLCHPNANSEEQSITMNRKRRTTKGAVPPKGFPNTDDVIAAVDVFMNPNVKSLKELPARPEINQDMINRILNSDCHWSQERIDKEKKASNMRRSRCQNKANQRKMTDYFQSQRSRKVPVVIECSFEENSKSSQRSFKAMERLRKKALLFTAVSTALSSTGAECGSMSGTVTPTTTTPPPAPKRPLKRKIDSPPGGFMLPTPTTLEKEVTPTTASAKRALVHASDEVSSASIIIIN